MKPKLICLFHQLENIHLTKDVGMIPYILQQEFDYESTMLCYNNGNYDYLNNEVKGLKIEFIKKRTGNTNIDTCLYLIKNAHRFDILQTYHPTIYGVLFLVVFKVINFYKPTKTHLKLDADEGIFTVNGYNKTKQNIYYFLIQFVNVVSVETTFLYDKLKTFKTYKKNLIFLPNGYYPKFLYNNDTKQNTMLCVGTVGEPRKENKILMDAFVKFYQTNKNWKLKFIGQIVNNFKEEIEKYFIQNPELVNIVSFTGSISDKKILKNEYQQAKILILTSKKEGFPLVFTEAMNSGCHIITSNVIAANDVTNYGKTGEIFPIGNIDELVNAMIKMDKKLSSLTHEMIVDYEKFREKFYWKDILKKLHQKLKLQ